MTPIDVDAPSGIEGTMGQGVDGYETNVRWRLVDDQLVDLLPVVGTGTQEEVSEMTWKPLVAATALAFGSACAAQTALAADEAQMMSMCNTYAAHHLHVSTSDIETLKYEGQRTDGTHAVNGNTTSGQTFQCSFNRKGTRVVHWTHTAPKGCPPDVSEADRYRYPDCE